LAFDRNPSVALRRPRSSAVRQRSLPLFSAARLGVPARSNRSRPDPAQARRRIRRSAAKLHVAGPPFDGNADSIAFIKENH